MQGNFGKWPVPPLTPVFHDLDGKSLNHWWRGLGVQMPLLRCLDCFGPVREFTPTVRA